MAKQIIINEIPNVIHDAVLDRIGNDFKWDHAKGMAEWLKNSVDAYRRNEVKQEDQHVVFRFTDLGVTKPIVECIDFMGMTSADIEKALKIWFDPNAAKRGKGVKVYGGHGNGGKFYMRQMFGESQFVTYKEGLLNIFGFNEKRRYGYARGFENQKMSPKEAMAYAEVEALPIPKDIKERILSGETGFTVVRGIRPEGVPKKFRIDRDIESFKNHPQARRILSRANVSVVYNGESRYALLRPDELEPHPDFKEPRTIPVPETLTVNSSGEKVTVTMANEKYPAGRLVLRTSAEPLSRGSKLGEMNRIDILGEIGVIGSYHLMELGVRGYPQAAFIYGELAPAHEGAVSILEDPDHDCVSNDREKLAKNNTTRALLEWVLSQIDELATDIAGQEREKQKADQKEITSKFNDVLNDWKNKHMSKIISDLFGGGGNGGNGGGPLPGPAPQILTVPPNGFDFKYPQADIEVNTDARITLKVCVPQTLRIGTTVFFKSDSNKVVLGVEKEHIKSEFLRSADNGQEVAFLNIAVVGTEVGAEGVITATAGKFSSVMKLVVVAEKEKKSGKAFPQVLLSGHDPDPLNIAPGGLVTLTERDPVVFQRPQDLEPNIYWINTSSVMASKIYDRFKFDSMEWRNYLFARYVDIFVKEAVHELQRKEFDNFNADRVDNKMAEVVNRVHQSAKDDLDQFLFDASYVTPKK